MKGLKINYDKTFATKYSRDYYRGASFHYSGKWAAGVHYVADSYNTDFCASHQVLLACKLSHTSDEYNDPAKHFIYDEDQNIIGIKSKYWDIVIAGINIIGETKEWVDERIDGVIEAYKADIEFSARGLRTEFTHDIDDAVNGVTRNYRSEISQTAEEIRSTVEAVETSLDGKMEENYSELKQRADSISATVAQNKSDIEGNLEQKYSELKMTADEISTTVSDVKTDLEGNINNKFSEISQRADQISARVEEVNSNLNGDLEEKYSELKMTADEITSTVAANKTELDNTIQENYSQLSQRADSITATVAQNRSDLEGNIEQRYAEMVMTADEISTTVAKNKSDLEGNIESKFSEVSQKADEIAARVEEVSQQSTGELEKKYSELIMTTDAISATVAANKTATDGSISDLNSNITQTATEIRSEVNQKITDVDGKVEEAKSSISQTAEQIMATVEANKTELDGTISANYSELKQTAEEISATVTANKNAADGSIANLRSDFSITAEQIRSEVAAEVETINGEISNTRSSITQTAGQIRSEVDAHVETLEGAISDTNSSITQTANQIISEVNEKVTDINGKISAANTAIEQNATDIGLRVTTENYNANNELVSQRISAIELDAEGIHNSVSALQTDLSDQGETLQGYINDLQDQIDGAIDEWFYEGIPTLNNLPASEWTSNEEKDKHIGDLYYNKTDGLAYRFVKDNSTYKWIEVTDTALAKALADAARAQDTADSKRRVFTSQPNPPYDIGDLWAQGTTNDGNGTILKCKVARGAGAIYVSTDWEEASDFTKKSVIKSSFDILADAIEGKVEQYDETGKLVPGSAFSKITQTRKDITLEVGTAKDEAIADAEGKVNGVKTDLLNTGINITDKNITLTANNVWLQNNAGTKARLAVETVNNTPVISAENLQLTGVLSTSAWNAGKTALEQYAEGKANTAANTALESAKTYANSTDYLTDYIVPKVTAGTNALKEVLEGEGGSIKAAQDTANSASVAAGNAQSTANSAIASIREVDYLKNALLEENTTVAGGLILSTLIQLGSGAKTGNWQVYSGLNGSYQGPTSIAFWAGGDMTESGSRAAKAVIRMDGTGYLAGGNISWDASGNASFNGDVVAKSFTIGTSDWNDVKSGILNDAASDATTKASAAESNAKSDTTTKITSLKNNEIKGAQDAANAAQTRADSAYALANGKADPGDITAAKDVVAQNLGYTNYSDMAAKAAAGKTIINGGYLRTELIETSAITIGSGQVTGLGTLATKSSISATSGDITGLGSLATKSTVSATNGDVTGLAGVATSGNYNDLSNKPNIPDVSGLAGKDDFAKKLGYTDYNAMVAAAQAGNTIISGGYIKTGLIDTDALVVKHLSGADGTFTGILSAATGSFSGSITANSGQIGGFTIGTSKLYNGLSTLNGTSEGVYLGTDGIALGGGKFKVTKDGAVIATNLTANGGFSCERSYDIAYAYSGGNSTRPVVDHTDVSAGKLDFYRNYEDSDDAVEIHIGGQLHNAKSESYLSITGDLSRLGVHPLFIKNTGTGMGMKSSVFQGCGITVIDGEISIVGTNTSFADTDLKPTFNSRLRVSGDNGGIKLEGSTISWDQGSTQGSIQGNKLELKTTSGSSASTAQYYSNYLVIATSSSQSRLYSDHLQIGTYKSNYPTDVALVINGTKSTAIRLETGIFEGLRPKTAYITTSNEILSDLYYNVIVNSSSNITVKLPSSPKEGQTYLIMNMQHVTLFISGNGKQIYSIGAQQTETTTTFSSRGVVLFIWNKYKDQWVVDVVNHY